MGRIHLFELEDQPWFPSLLRDAGTAYLRKAAALTGQPGFMAPKLAELLRSSGARRLVDLCSGGGGPVPEILDELGLVHSRQPFPEANAPSNQTLALVPQLASLI